MAHIIGKDIVQGNEIDLAFHGWICKNGLHSEQTKFANLEVSMYIGLIPIRSRANSTPVYIFIPNGKLQKIHPGLKTIVPNSS